MLEVTGVTVRVLTASYLKQSLHMLSNDEAGLQRDWDCRLSQRRAYGILLRTVAEIDLGFADDYCLRYQGFVSYLTLLFITFLLFSFSYYHGLRF
jgi:hypothetical protein